MSWKPDYKEELTKQLEDTDYDGYKKTEWLKKRREQRKGQFLSSK